MQSPIISLLRASVFGSRVSAIHTAVARRSWRLACALPLTLTAAACGGSSDSGNPDSDAGDTLANPAPTSPVSTLESVPLASRLVGDESVFALPAAAPDANDTQAELGRLLFWDPLLSAEQDVACATCHLPELGYTDGQHQSIGVGGIGRGAMRQVGYTGRVRRNAQSVLNTAWNGLNERGLFNPATAPMFRDNRAMSLESQALDPLRSRDEMRGDTVSLDAIDALLEARLNANAEYVALFAEVYGAGSITLDQVAEALAEFQRRLVANNSPYDQWVRGDDTAMTPAQLAGLEDFIEVGCHDCHQSPMFSDFQLHVLGASEGIDVLEPDNGAGNFDFRTPTLRQLRFTGPYFHAGQEASVASAVAFYDGNQSSSNPNVLNRDLAPLFTATPPLGPGRVQSIETFLDALNDNDFDQIVPQTVPSGLPPGGNI